MASLVPPDHEDREELHAELKEAEAEQMRIEEEERDERDDEETPQKAS